MANVETDGNDKIPLTALHIDSIYVQWLTALQEDDVETIRTIYNNSACQDTLLNGAIVTKELFNDCKTQFFPNRSLWLAGLYGSFKVFQEFMAFKPDVIIRDKYKNNIVHAFIYMAYYQERREQILVDMYKMLMQLVDMDTRCELLHAENADGLRPLVGACSKCGNFSSDDGNTGDQTSVSR
eukprot:GHVU01077801.1.p2 GENE.GHVU01077801.1~~GHVU01077801.1.p2  ORF type:complete len:182 (+),score=19.60 GHVU01077801.1:301-846(+)